MLALEHRHVKKQTEQYNVCKHSSLVLYESHRNDVLNLSSMCKLRYIEFLSRN